MKKQTNKQHVYSQTYRREIFHGRGTRHDRTTPEGAEGKGRRDGDAKVARRGNGAGGFEARPRDGHLEAKLKDTKQRQEEPRREESNSGTRAVDEEAAALISCIQRRSTPKAIDVLVASQNSTVHFVNYFTLMRINYFAFIYFNLLFIYLFIVPSRFNLFYGDN